MKNAVDDAIDQCAVVYNLREAIEESRVRAEQATDDRQRKIHMQKGLQNLRRYFELMVFQWYLQSIEPDTMRSFESIETFVKKRPVIQTFIKDLEEDGMNALNPLERTDVVNGMAHPDDVQQVVLNRSGSILSASTILKSDFFSNLQKMSLPECVFLFSFTPTSLNPKLIGELMARLTSVCSHLCLNQFDLARIPPTTPSPTLR